MLASSARGEVDKARGHGATVGGVREHDIEPLPHGMLRRVEGALPGSRQGEAHGPTVTVDRSSLHETPFDERVDRGRHGGAGEREAARDPARLSVAIGEEGEQPVLGERQLVLGALEQAHQPRQGPQIPVSRPGRFADHG